MIDASVNQLAGREAAPALRVTLALTAGAAGFIGLVLLAAGLTGDGPVGWFAWPVHPVPAILLGAGFLGALPMLVVSAMRVLWEEVRIPVSAAAPMVAGLTAVTVTDLGHTSAGGGDVAALALSIAWLIGVAGLTILYAVALAMTATEPGLPLARTTPFPRWSVPLVGLEGSALLGLGLGLLVRPGFWGTLLPWDTDAFDSRILGVWCLSLGLALLLALIEDDLPRVRPGLLGIAAISVLALLGLLVRSGDVDWSGWPAVLAVALLAGVAATGIIGLLLAGRSR